MKLDFKGFETTVGNIARTYQPVKIYEENDRLVFNRCIGKERGKIEYKSDGYELDLGTHKQTFQKRLDLRKYLYFIL